MYIARKTDGALFKKNKYGKYDLMGTDKSYNLKSLLDKDFFEEIKEEDLPMIYKRQSLYQDYKNWSDDNGKSFKKFKKKFGIIDTFGIAEDLL